MYMQRSDIKNLAFLTEALRGRDSHTQISDVFNINRPFDRDSVVEEIYIFSDEDDDMLDEQLGVIGQDPNTNKYFFAAQSSMSDIVTIRKYYFDPNFNIGEILEIGVSVGALYFEHDIYGASMNDIVNNQGEKFLEFLHRTGIDVPDFHTLLEPIT
jgi:hypothetical protein